MITNSEATLKDSDEAQIRHELVFSIFDQWLELSNPELHALADLLDEANEARHLRSADELVAAWS
jgi:hypothetical protein